MSEDLRGVFFIIKGQYRHKCEPQWYNPVAEGVNWCGGYDPSRPDTVEWYQLVDSITLTCHRAGGNLDYVLSGVEHMILTYKTRDNLEKVINAMSFGAASKSTKVLNDHLGQLYGHHFAALVREREDRAYRHLKYGTPVSKVKKLKRRAVSVTVEKRESLAPAERVTDTTQVTYTKRKKLVPKKR